MRAGPDQTVRQRAQSACGSGGAVQIPSRRGLRLDVRRVVRSAAADYQD